MKTVFIRLLIAATLLVLSGATALADGPRVALIIGNSAYQHTAPLANPINDAQDLARELEQLDFSVTLVTDATNAQMARAVRDFAGDAQRRRAETALFFYAGHGVQHEGINFLLPVDADIQDDYELLDAAMSMDRVSAALDTAGTRFNLIVLDACRDNPFARTRSASRGLTVMGGAGRGNMVVFATAPGDVAADGTGRNSPFTAAFLEHLRTPDLEVRQLITEVQRGVQNRTSGRQIPWVNTSFTGEFYFATAEQQLARTRQQEQALQDELAAIEAEIAERAARIEQAASAAERSRLEAEQQRARAEEAARRLEAQQLAEIEAQARRALEQRQADEALRAQMEQQLSAQRVSLTRQAEERRSQLEQLQRRSTADASLFDRLEAIAEVNRAINDIQSRFDATITRMEQEVNSLFDTRVATVRENNPREPWDTAEEYEVIITTLTAELEGERETDLAQRRAGLEASRESELSDLRERLGEYRRAITGQEYTLGAGSTAVEVARFNAEEKRFPIHVRTTDDRHAFAIPVSYAIDSTDRQVLRDEYYRVFSADQSGGLAGEITYTVFELERDLWVLQPTRTRVINLLEGDTELIRFGGGAGQMLVSTASAVEPVAGVIRFESEIREPAEVWIDGRRTGTTDLQLLVRTADDLGTRRIEYRWRDGTRRVFAVNLQAGINAPVLLSRGDEDVTRLGMILVTGAPPGTEVHPGALTTRSETVPEGQSQVLVSVPDGTHSVRVSGRWLSGTFNDTIRVSPAASGSPVIHINLADHGIFPAGELQAAFPGDVQPVVSVFNPHGDLVMENVSLQQGTALATLVPGDYQLVARQQDDPYPAVVLPVSVAAQQTTQLSVSELPLSARFQLETAQAHHTRVEQRISRQRPRRIIGWSLLGAGVLGIGGAGYSYIQAQDAIAAYDRATTTAGVSSARGDVQQWGMMFSLSAIIGGVSALTGTGLVALGPNQGALIQERNELDRRINTLSAEAARRQAENALFGRSGR